MSSPHTTRQSQGTGFRDRRPGQAIAPVERAVIERLNLHAGCVVHAGTVPSVAEFLSSGLSYPGDALTHLGSRLRVQLLSDVPVAEDVAMGLRCYRLDRSWLVEATSNTGGNVVSRPTGPSALRMKMAWSGAMLCPDGTA